MKSYVAHLITYNDVQRVTARIIVLNPILKDISIISRQPVLLVDETEVPMLKPLTCSKLLANVIT
jgi:hypothetical protein